MFSHSGPVAQSESIHNGAMWDWQNRNSCNIQSVGGGPVNLFTLPRPLSKPTHLEISPTRCALHWLDGIFFGGTVFQTECYILNPNLQARRELSGNCLLSSHLIRSHLLVGSLLGSLDNDLSGRRVSWLFIHLFIFLSVFCLESNLNIDRVSGSSTFGKLVLVFPSDTFPYIPGVFLGFVG